MPIFDVSFGAISQPPLKHLTNHIRSVGFSDPLFQIKVAEALETLAERRLHLKGSVNIPSAPQSTIFAPMVDETDVAWYGTADTMDAATDPVTIHATITGTSRFGMETNIQNPGQAYTAATAVVTDSMGNTNGAAISLTVGASGQVIAATVTNSGFGLVPPLTVTVSGDGTGAMVEAFVGRQFNANDLVVFNNPTIDANGRYSYEIDLITSIVWHDATHADMVLQRGNPGGLAGQAQMGSYKNVQSGMNFWRLIPVVISATEQPIMAGPQTTRFPGFESMLIPAIQVNSLPLGSSNTPVQGLTPQGDIFNLAPQVSADSHFNPPAPGLRTFSGNAYISLKLSGPLTVGQTLDTRAVLSGGWEAYRVASATARTPPVGATPFHGISTAAIVIYLCLITSDLKVTPQVAWIDTLVILDGDFQSYDPLLDAPDGPIAKGFRQMPYHSFWQPTTAIGVDWPPMLLPLFTAALDGSGNLVLSAPPAPPTVDPANQLVWQPDYYIDAIVAQIGTGTAGSDVTIRIET